MTSSSRQEVLTGQNAFCLTQLECTWELLDGLVGGRMRSEHVEQVATRQLEVGQQAWWKLPIQPSTESLHNSMITKHGTLLVNPCSLLETIALHGSLVPLSIVRAAMRFKGSYSPLHWAH